MPQLRSGRHVALSISPYLDALASGPDESRYFATVALRLNTSTPAALRDHVVIGYFVEGEGTPPNAPSYNSGYCVADILEGRSDWSAEEVTGFRSHLAEPRFEAWLQAQFEDLDEALRNNRVWSADLMTNDSASGDIDASMLRRAVIRKSAMEPTAMAQLRASGQRS